MARPIVFDINQAKSALPAERRNARRNKAHAEAWTDPGGMDPAILCKVIDISHAGARLLFAHDVEVPDRFYLQTGSSKRIAHVIWRKENQIGVEFELRRRSDLAPELAEQEPPKGVRERRSAATVHDTRVKAKN